MDFQLKSTSSIVNTLKRYYVESDLEKKTGHPFEDQMYKAEELFAYKDKGQVCSWQLVALEDYFGVPVYDYLLLHQDYYMEGCKRQYSKSRMRQYLKTPFLRNKMIKFHISSFRMMVAAMR